MRKFFVCVLAAALSFPATAFSLPQGEKVSSGSASFDRSDSSTLQITASDKAVINYDSFNIGQGETVRFLQPSADSVALNRVTGGDPSQLFGSLLANGKIFLLNPNGIFFGPGSVVNTGSFMASTLEMKDSDFLAGNYDFQLTPGFDGAAIINQGTITVSPEGYCVLVSPLVSNEGMIVAQSGQVAVGGTSKASVSFDGQGLLNFAVSGLDRAPGTVLVPQSQATQLVKDVVNCDSLVPAGSVIEENGVIRLVAAEGVAINSGAIEANGSAGKNAGSIVLNSSQATAFTPTGRIEAKGVGENSDGGFAEVSTKGLFSIMGKVDLTAQSGKTGTLLIDPYDVTIAGANINDSWAGGIFTATGTATILETTLEDYLNAADVTIRTSGAGSDPGDIYVDADIDYAGVNGRTLSLVSDRNIHLRNGGISLSGAGSLSLSATGGAILIEKPVTAGSISMNSAGDITLINDIAATSGDISIVAGGTFSAGTNRCITGAGGTSTVSITGWNDLTLGGATLALGRRQLVQTGSGGVYLASAGGTDISLGYRAISIDEGLLNLNTGGATGGAIVSSFSGENILADGDVTMSGNGVGTVAAPLTIAGDSSGDSALEVSSGTGELGLTIKTDQFNAIDITQDSVSNIAVTLPMDDAVTMLTGGDMYPQLTVNTHAVAADFSYTSNDTGVSRIDLLGLDTGTATAQLEMYSSLIGSAQVICERLSLISRLGSIELTNADNRIAHLGSIEAYGGDFTLSNNCPLTLHDYVYAAEADDSYQYNILIDNHGNPIDFSADFLLTDGFWSNNVRFIASDITNLQNGYFGYVYNRVSLQPYDAASTIGLGGLAGASGAAFELDQGELDTIVGDFSGYSIEIGHPDGTGALLLGADVVNLSGSGYLIHSGRVNDLGHLIDAGFSNALVMDLNSTGGANALRLIASCFAADTTGGTTQADKSLTLQTENEITLGATIFDNDVDAENPQDVYYDLNTGNGDLTLNALQSVQQLEPLIDETTGDILGAGRMLIGGTVNFVGTGVDFSLDQRGNDFDIVTGDVTGSISLYDENAIVLGDIQAGGLYVYAKGAVTGTGAIVGESLSCRTYNDAGASITLNNPANDVDYLELVSRDASDSANAAGTISYIDLDGFEIDTLYTSGSATLVAGNAVTNDGSIVVDTLSVKTKKDGGAAITLNDLSNNVSSLSLQSRNAADTADAAGDITFNDMDGFGVTSIRTTGTASLRAFDETTGSITLNGPVYAGTSILEAGLSIINAAGANDNVITTGNASFKAHTGTAGTSAAKLNVTAGGLLNVEAGGQAGGYSAYFYGSSSDNTAHLLADWATPGALGFDQPAPAPAPSTSTLALQNQRQAEAQTNGATGNQLVVFLQPFLNFLSDAFFAPPQFFLQKGE